MSPSPPRHDPRRKPRSKPRSGDRVLHHRGATNRNEQREDQLPRAALVYKPYGVLTQFRPERSTDSAESPEPVTQATPKPRPTLASLFPFHGYSAAGRLDRDSEGLLILTRDGRLQAAITHPRHRWVKTYWAEVEGHRGETDIDAAALECLAKGVDLNDGPTRICDVRSIPTPQLPLRDPPVRFRREIPTFWIELKLREGRNRQVRRMTAAVGYPTLRLIRVAIGPWSLFEQRDEGAADTVSTASQSVRLDASSRHSTSAGRETFSPVEFASPQHFAAKRSAAYPTDGATLLGSVSSRAPRRGVGGDSDDDARPDPIQHRTAIDMKPGERRPPLKAPVDTVSRPTLNPGEWRWLDENEIPKDISRGNVGARPQAMTRSRRPRP